jgi:dTDP-4-amino-4,6-dideoxygalactose transaminase
MWKVQLFELNYDAREAEAVQEVLESRWITMGPKTTEFEDSFGEFLGEGNCTAVSSGTAALHMALMALGIGPGDEVILPSLNFIAGANVIRLVGATPVLADCESYDDWNIGVEDVRSKIGPRTAAIMCVHYAGYPCHMRELMQLCQEKDLKLIEDVAHAPGGTYEGKALGTFGDIGCFSFFTNKNLSVGEGGMVVTRSKDTHERIKLMRSHGMTTLTLDRHRGRAISYDVIQPGLNYRIDEMRAAIGSVQLSKLQHANEQRTALAQHYNLLLRDVEEISIPFLDYKPDGNTYHIYPILLAEGIDRNSLVLALKMHGVQASIHYPSLLEFQAYVDLPDSTTPIADDISGRELTLPLFPTMGNEKVEYVCKALVDSLAELT